MKPIVSFSIVCIIMCTYGLRILTFCFRCNISVVLLFLNNLQSKVVLDPDVLLLSKCVILKP